MPDVSEFTKNRLFERVIIWRARKANPDLSHAKLAGLLGKSESSVRRVLALYDVAPKDLLQAAESDAVQAWTAAIPIAARKGDHRPSKDLLLHTGAIAPVTSATNTQIALIFGSIDVPGLVLSRAERDGSHDLLSNNAYIDAHVAQAAESAIAVAGTPEGDPGGGSAKPAGDFVPESRG